jgi:hypothetical protein
MNREKIEAIEARAKLASAVGDVVSDARFALIAELAAAVLEETTPAANETPVPGYMSSNVCLSENALAGTVFWQWDVAWERVSGNAAFVRRAKGENSGDELSAWAIFSPEIVAWFAMACVNGATIFTGEYEELRDAQNEAEGACRRAVRLRSRER